jgi:hypothetical protein
MKFETCRHNFEKNIFKYDISWKPLQWKPSCSMRADRRTGMTKTIFAFSNFANAPKIYWSERYLKYTPVGVVTFFRVRAIVSVQKSGFLYSRGPYLLLSMSVISGKFNDATLQTVIEQACDINLAKLVRLVDARGHLRYDCMWCGLRFSVQISAARLDKACSLLSAFYNQLLQECSECFLEGTLKPWQTGRANVHYQF